MFVAMMILRGTQLALNYFQSKIMPNSISRNGISKFSRCNMTQTPIVLMLWIFRFAMHLRLCMAIIWHALIFKSVCVHNLPQQRFYLATPLNGESIKIISSQQLLCMHVHYASDRLLHCSKVWLSVVIFVSWGKAVVYSSAVNQMRPALWHENPIVE